jgi:hypothetical protein
MNGPGVVGTSSRRDNTITVVGDLNAHGPEIQLSLADGAEAKRSLKDHSQITAIDRSKRWQGILKLDNPSPPAK